VRWSADICHLLYSGFLLLNFGDVWHHAPWIYFTFLLPILAPVAWHCCGVHLHETLLHPWLWGFISVASCIFWTMDCCICFCGPNTHINVLLWIHAFLMDFGLMFFIYCQNNGCALLHIHRWLALCCEVWTTCANSHLQLLLNLSDVLHLAQQSCLLYQWRILVTLLHICQLIWQTSMTDSFLCLFCLGLGTCQVHINQPEQQLYKSACNFHCIWHCSTWVPLLLCNSYQLFWKCLLPNVSLRLQGMYMLVVVTHADR